LASRWPVLGPGRLTSTSAYRYWDWKPSSDRDFIGLEVTTISAAGFALSGKSPTSLTWTEQASATGPGILYDVVGGTISVLRSSGLSAATSCVGSALTVPSFSDTRPAPGPGACFYYLVRARNACGTGGFGAGRSALDTLACP